MGAGRRSCLAGLPPGRPRRLRASAGLPGRGPRRQPAGGAGQGPDQARGRECGGDAHARATEQAMNGQRTRAGFAAIVGAPNAGKSTLVNALVGSKVSIVSPKVQTTRMRVIGIAMTDVPDCTLAQVVLVDTPGILRIAQSPLDRGMVTSAWHVDE